MEVVDLLRQGKKTEAAIICPQSILELFPEELREMISRKRGYYFINQILSILLAIEALPDFIKDAEKLMDTVVSKHTDMKDNQEITKKLLKAITDFKIKNASLIGQINWAD